MKNLFSKNTVNVLLIICIIGIILIVVPMIVNYWIIGRETPELFTLYGETKDWHNFWAVYLGAIIGASVPFIILNRTIQNNKVENERNRNIQINTIKYQTKIAWINQLRNIIGFAHEKLSFAVDDKYRQLQKRNENSLSDLTSELFNNANDVKQKFVSILYGCGQYEEEFLIFIDSFCKRFLCYIFDLEFLYELKFPMESDLLEYKVELYKRRRNSVFRHDKRVWYIIEERDFKTSNEDFSYYMNEVSKRYEFQDFEYRCLELLKYELNKAEEILNGSKKNK